MKLWFNIVSMDRESPVFFFVRMESTLFFPYNGDTIVLEGFPDFPGEIKSLGAWGGDFILAASS